MDYSSEFGPDRDNAELSKVKFDFAAMHERCCTAISVLGFTQKGVSAKMGVDTSIPLHERTPLRPTAQNIRRVSEILGVSVHWIVTGEAQNDVDALVVSSCAIRKANQAHNTHGSVLIQGNEKSTIIVNILDKGSLQFAKQLAAIAHSMDPDRVSNRA